MKKKVFLDSSSAILMEKSDLLPLFFKVYDVSLTEAVYSELTNNQYPSAELFHKSYQQSCFEVRPLPEQKRDRHSKELDSLNLGERETIQQYFSGVADFIVLDDGKAARFCKREQVPFINALLFPKILQHSELLSKEDCRSRLDVLISIGRYSSRVLSIAEGMGEKELKRFFP